MVNILAKICLKNRIEKDMKKMMTVYIIVALIAILIAFVFLTTTRFSVIMEYEGNSETVVKDVSLKQYSEISGELRETYDEMSEIAYDSYATDEGGMLLQISTGFGMARILSFGVAILVCGGFIAIWTLIKFVFSFIIPKSWKIYKRFDFSYNEIIMLFQGTLFVFMAPLIFATISAHIASWWISIMIQKMSVHIVYTSGINYIWGALIIGIVMLVGKLIAQYLGKDESKKESFVQEKL